MHEAYPAFDSVVPPNGYHWWYLDAISDDGSQALTVIVFHGSVFSPYYAWSRRSGDADPLHFCSMNVVLYGPRRKLWCMTERPREAVQRTSQSFQIGRSSIRWDQGRLRYDIDERTAPIPQRVTGSIELETGGMQSQNFALDAQDEHRWHPLLPNTRISVQFQKPKLAWTGSAYHDANWGSVPLESSFARWQWSRCQQRDFSEIDYVLDERSGRHHHIALRIDREGSLTQRAAQTASALPSSRWGITRNIWSGGPAEVERTVEDAPFYARSIVRSEEKTFMHESLSLDRFQQPVVQAMLAFKIPRRRLR